MKRIACVVEGRGDVAAVPNLIARILNHLGESDWRVQRDPIRQPRGYLVRAHGTSKSPAYDTARLAAIVAAVRARAADAMIIVCDADDDCAARWGPAATGAITAQSMAGGAIMVVREYEAWLLTRFDSATLARVRVSDVEGVRDAKGRLARIVSGYLPTHHQLEQTRLLEIERARQLSPSFDKLVRVVGEITGRST